MSIRINEEGKLGYNLCLCLGQNLIILKKATHCMVSFSLLHIRAYRKIVQICAQVNMPMYCSKKKKMPM